MGRRKRSSAIVPGLVLGASFVAVVPVCAVACSGNDPITNMRNIQQWGVAAVAYCCFEGGGVAEMMFDAKMEAEASTDAPDGDTATDAPSDAPEGG